MDAFFGLFKGKILSRLFGDKARAQPVPPAAIERAVSPRIKPYAVSTAFLFERMQMKGPSGSSDVQSALAWYFSDCQEKIRQEQRKAGVESDPAHFSRYILHIIHNLQRSVHEAENGVIYFNQDHLQAYADQTKHIKPWLAAGTTNPIEPRGENVVDIFKNRPKTHNELQHMHECLLTWIVTQPFYSIGPAPAPGLQKR